MQKLVCDVCGGPIEMQAGGQNGICTCCGIAYSLDRMKEIYSGMKVSITGTKEDVEQWKTLLKRYISNCDFEAAESIVKKILEANPNDEYAVDIYKNLQDWKYYEIKNGVLIKYNGKALETKIPYGITEIGDSAFYGCSTLKSVIISDSVITIGDYAFHGCSKLESVLIPNTITSIRSYAFYNCASLKSIEIPDSVTSIGPYAFRGCASLKSIEIPDSVTSIYYDTFYHCYSLESISIPDSVTSIGAGAFINCTSLVSIKIPDSVTSIGAGAFSNCTSLEAINIPDSVTSIEDYVFSGCTSLINRYKKQNKCIYCGGEFKGVFTKVCSRCGKLKNY